MKAREGREGKKDSREAGGGVGGEWEERAVASGGEGERGRGGFLCSLLCGGRSWD